LLHQPDRNGHNRGVTGAVASAAATVFLKLKGSKSHKALKAIDRMKKLERAFKESKISKEMYEELKKKYEDRSS